ncbi:MAG: flavin reductase family protein [Dehalococcoidia bacterium]
MLKVVAEDIGAFYQHYPRTAAIVTVSHEGRRNAMAVAWHCPVSFNPPLYGIAVAPKRFSYNMICGSGQFAINFMPLDSAETIAAVGGSSGSLSDKFTQFDLQDAPAIKTEAPILKEAYAAYECMVFDNRIFGDHAWIIGSIVAVHADGEVFKADGTLDLDLLQPALYLGAETYCAVDKSKTMVLERQKYGGG